MFLRKFTDVMCVIELDTGHMGSVKAWENLTKNELLSSCVRHNKSDLALRHCNTALICNVNYECHMTTSPTPYVSHVSAGDCVAERMINISLEAKQRA